MKKRKEALSVVALLLLLMTSMSYLVRGDDETNVVGVEAGDWVKYSVTRLGSSNFAWLRPDAVWIKVEVLTTSNTSVTAHETIHNADGSEIVKNSSWNLENDRAFLSYIIATGLTLGDNVGECLFWRNETNEYEYVNVTLNTTELRSYGGATREVNSLKFSYVTPYFSEMANFTVEGCWDNLTGFLLEQKIQCYLIGFEEYPPSTYKVKIADTNMWEMETEHSFPWQALAVTIPVGVIIIGTVAIKLKNSRKKNKAEEK